MSGVIGSVDITGLNVTISGASEANLNYQDVQTFATGDIVTQFDIYLNGIQSGAGEMEVALISGADLTANRDGSVVWLKRFTIPDATASGWYTVVVADEAITATVGHQLGVAISDKISGENIVTKSSANNGEMKSTAASAPFGASWLETGTAVRNIAVTVTTAAGSAPRGITNIDGDNNVQAGQNGVTINVEGLDIDPATKVVLLNGISMPITHWNGVAL